MALNSAAREDFGLMQITQGTVTHLIPGLTLIN